MIIPSILSFAEQFQCVVATLSEQDWNDNVDALSKIRKLATKPRRSKSNVPERNPLQSSSSSAKSLSELLKLPIHGQVTSEEVESGLATLKSERDITDHCSNMGMKPSAISLVKTVLRSFSHSKDVFKNIWDGSRFYETEGTPERRLLDAHHAISVEGHVNGARYRINALVFACVYHARVQQLGAAAKRETLILRKLEEESGKSRFQINDALKRGRWYLSWVNKLGIGAIFALGESFATGMYMQDIDQVVDACKSIQGFHQRSSDLSSIARTAIEQAIAKSHGSHSGSAVQGIETERRYIEQAGTAEMPSTNRNAYATIDSTRAPQISTTRSPQQNASAEAAQSAITRASFSAPVPSSNTQNAGDQQNFLSQWRPCAPRSRPPQDLAQSSSTGSALRGTIASNAMLLESNETVYSAGAAHQLALPEQSYLGTSHGYGGASGSGSTWEECSDDQFGNLLGIWDVTFP